MHQMPPPELPSPARQPPAGPVTAPLVPLLVPPPIQPLPIQPLPIQPLPIQLPRRQRQRPLPDAVAVRRVPLPQQAPPYDDEARGASAMPGSPPGPGAGPAPQQPGTARPPVAAADQRRPAAGEWPSQFAQVLAETLAGARPARQMTPWTTEQARRRIRQLGPELSSDQRPRVRRVLTSMPDRNVVEMTVIVGVGPRIRALAVRLERASPDLARPDQERRWLCTDIEAA